MRESWWRDFGLCWRELAILLMIVFCIVSAAALIEHGEKRGHTDSDVEEVQR